MINIIELQIEEKNKKLKQIKQVLLEDKLYFVNTIINALKLQLNLKFFFYKVQDIDGNIVDILVKENSDIYIKYILNKEILNINAEMLLDNRMFTNTDQIILLDLNSNEKYINMEYLCNSLNYSNLSYSKNLQEILVYQIDNILTKKINNLK
ncbi:MAG: hypothetical protein RSC92_01125 [Clostridia bacterium]